MYSDSSKFERPSLHLSLDSFHDAEGLPIPGPYDNRPESPKIVNGDQDEDDPRAGSYISPDLDQKITQELLATDQSHSQAAFDFYRPPVPVSYDTDDFSMSPAAMFLSSFSPSASLPARSPDAEGEIVSGYRLGPVVAYGGFSTIRCASSASGGTVAVKIVRRSDISVQQDPMSARRRLDHEASVWLSLSHEHILPLFSAVHTTYADFFIMLYCPAGSLFDIMKRDGRPALPQDDAGTMFRQVVRGLRYLHEVAGLVHRDIKLENVLVDEMGVCRIGDFGMSRNIGESDADDQALTEMQQQRDVLHRSQSRGGELRPTFAQAKRQTGAGRPIHLSLIRRHSGLRHRNSTPVGGNTSAIARPVQNFRTGSLPYAAPELLMPEFSASVQVDPAQDIWALGVMLYAMLTGRLPFMDTFDPRLQMKILHGVYDVPPGIGRGAELVLKGCMERSPTSRWTISMVDDVAWGVGWGPDDTSAPVEAGSGIPSSDLRPSLEIARRRSSSRAKRSLSRSASVLRDGRSRASTRNKSRSATRSSGHPPPPYSTLADSIISSTSSNSSVPFDLNHHQESASFTQSCIRGTTRAHVRSPSRSPSPSVPSTPIDFVGGLGGRHPLNDVMEDVPSRGRAPIRDGITHRRSIDTQVPPKYVDVIDETSTQSTDVDNEQSNTFSELLRRLNPLTYLRDQNSNSAPDVRPDDKEDPGRSGNLEGAGSAPSIGNSTTG